MENAAPNRVTRRSQKNQRDNKKKILHCEAPLNPQLQSALASAAATPRSWHPQPQTVAASVSPRLLPTERMQPQPQGQRVGDDWTSI